MSDLEEPVLVITTGGTLDKIYFDAKSEFEVGSSVVGEMLKQGEVKLPFEIKELLRKDSLELTDEDRDLISDTVLGATQNRVVITHGTDTMTVTAKSLAKISGKTIVLTGALAPARFADTDAMFNLGMAFAAVQSKGPGVFIAMNGYIFDAEKVTKDRKNNVFVPVR